MASSDLLSLYPTTTLASHNTIILIITHKPYKPLIQLINQRINQLIQAQLQNSSAGIGIATHVSQKVDICIAALEWIEDVRALLSPSKDDKYRKNSNNNNNNNNKKDQKTLELPEWGDVQTDTILSFLDDISLVVSSETKTNLTSSLYGTVLSHVPETIEAALEMVTEIRQNHR